MAFASVVDNRMRVFVTMRHSAFTAKADTEGFADPFLVGDHAAELARIYFAREFSQHLDHYVAQARDAGAMIYAIEHYGETYETVGRLGGLDVAAVVASATPDNRQPPNQRHDDHASCIARAAPMVQIVKLAEIMCLAKDVARANPQVLRKYGDAWKVRLAHARELLNGMDRISRNGTIADYIHRARTLITSDIDRIRSGGVDKHANRDMPAVATATAID